MLRYGSTILSLSIITEFRVVALKHGLCESHWNMEGCFTWHMASQQQNVLSQSSPWQLQVLSAWLVVFNALWIGLSTETCWQLPAVPGCVGDGTGRSSECSGYFYAFDIHIF